MWHSPGVPRFMLCPCVRDSLALLCSEGTPQLVQVENATLRSASILCGMEKLHAPVN